MTPARQRALIAGLIIVGVLLAGFFGLRAVHAFRQFRGHRPPPLSAAEAHQAETDVELIRDWMTVPFVSKMYQVPPKELFDAIEVQPQGNQEKSLEQLNREYYPQAEGIVMTKIKAAILEYQSQEMPALPTPQSPIKPIGPIPP